MPSTSSPLVDEARLWQRIESLARFGATPAGGVTRLALSAEDRAAASEVGRWLEPLGFAHRLDSAGNHFWRYSNGSQEAAVLVGSHLDSVPSGGRFDGAAGVVAAAEVAQVLVTSGHELRRPIEVVSFANEEGVRFPGGLTGSQAVAGRFTNDDLLDATDGEGLSLREALAAFGVANPSLLAARRAPESVHAYFELHVEQGGVLEQAGAAVGLVSGITGLLQARFELTGRAGHAGATPMEGRRDPMAGAAQVVRRVEELARSSAGLVRGTVGWLRASPGADNVIPDRVTFSVDLRSVDSGALAAAAQALWDAVEATSSERDLAWRVISQQHTQPVKLSEALLTELQIVAVASGQEHLTLPSGAGHDAMIMQSAWPTAMVFVRSRDGLSHCPEEYSAPADLAAGARLLLAGVARAVGVDL
ncbi:MAG: Zn-dependent hydrolase [Trueperaceae bacterium]